MKASILNIYFAFFVYLVVGADPELHELRESPPKIDENFARASRLTEEAISKLQLESEELQNAYIQVLLTDSLAEDQNPNRILRDESPSADWREAVKRDILRRGASVQPVIEKIFRNNDGVSTTLLRKIGALPQIDKEPFVRWVREFLNETGTDKVQSIRLSQLADFIARHGSLDDLEYLERVAKDVPLDDPARLHLIERRKSELLGRTNESELEVVEVGKGGNRSLQAQADVPGEKDPANQEEERVPRGSASESPVWLYVLVAVALVGIVVILVRSRKGNSSR